MSPAEAFSIHWGKSGGFVPYADYMQSECWTDKSRAYRAMVGRCENCGATSGLSVHHRHYRTLGRERPEDLIVLCSDCHQARHRKSTK